MDFSFVKLSFWGWPHGHRTGAHLRAMLNFSQDSLLLHSLSDWFLHTRQVSFQICTLSFKDCFFHSRSALPLWGHQVPSLPHDPTLLSLFPPHCLRESSYNRLREVFRGMYRYLSGLCLFCLPLRHVLGVNQGPQSDKGARNLGLLPWQVKHLMWKWLLWTRTTSPLQVSPHR